MMMPFPAPWSMPMRPEIRAPFINGAPNLTVDIPALSNLARERNLRSAGRISRPADADEDILAPGLKARLLGLSGWFSTNILATGTEKCLTIRNHLKRRRVQAFRAGIHLQPDVYPQLYKDFYHKIRINYYPRDATTKKAGTTSTYSDGWVIHADQGEFSVS